MPDPNFPGMRVCKEDLDNFDPWRLPALQTENIALRFPRPDTPVAIGPVSGEQIVTAPNPDGPIDSPVGQLIRKPNNPSRNSIFITQDRTQSTTAGKSGDLKI
jgi:hypothetical protein